MKAMIANIFPMWLRPGFWCLAVASLLLGSSVLSEIPNNQSALHVTFCAFLSDHPCHMTNPVTRSVVASALTAN